MVESLPFYSWLGTGSDGNFSSLSLEPLPNVVGGPALDSVLVPKRYETHYAQFRSKEKAFFVFRNLLY